jgi:hypothetical protein
MVKQQISAPGIRRPARTRGAFAGIILDGAPGGNNGLLRVVATRIEQDGTMQRRMVDTARRNDGPRWEDLAARALACPPAYRPVPGVAVYHLSVDDHLVQVGGYYLDGALRDLVTVVLAAGDEV